MKVGSYVEWDSSGGTASGVIVQIVEDGDVPNIDAKITGTTDDPAARIQVYRKDDEGNYEKTDTYVGHKLTELRPIKSLASSEMLNARQNFIVSSFITAVEYLGMFNKGTGADGAHYMPAEKNPFASEGLACKNCVFYAEDSQACAIVSGEIEENAICKLWVIEEYELTQPDMPEPEIDTEVDLEDSMQMTSSQRYPGIDFSPPDGVKSAAKRGLALHEKGLSGGGLEPATVAWARKYVNNQSVSPERARMGNRFFGRNARFANAPKDSPAWVSWLLWGGASGKAWFSSLVRQMDAQDKKKSSASVHGFIKVAEDSNHPLMKEVELILTDFEPNANKEGIPLSEAENIIKTAKNTPLKIAAASAGYGGHNGAIPVGPITEVYLDNYEGRQVIRAKAFIWSEEFKDVYTMLKAEAGERDYVGTSWEVYYRSSEVIDGVNWLQNVTFAGTCIVDVPAYGDRTKLLKVAEKEMNEPKQDSVESKITEQEALINELRQKVEKYEQEAQERALAERKASVSALLSKAGLAEQEIADTLETYLALDEDALKVIVSQLEKRQVQTQASKKDTSEQLTIPNPLGTSDPLSPSSLAKSLKNKLGRQN